MVIKQNPANEETWRYPGIVLKRDQQSLVVEAFFNREDMDFHGMSICQGDRFVETYYYMRWYNVFEIYDRQDNHLKGWYCNISSPALEKDGKLLYRDLALDLLVFPDGKQIVLDEDEFLALEITPREHEQALAALAELRTFFNDKLKAASR